MQRSMGVPLIPGMLSTHHRETSKADFRKRQVLEQMSNGKALDVEAAALGMFGAKLHQLRQGTHASASTPPPPPVATAVSNKGNGNGGSSTKYRVDATLPAWITNDRQVLRFFGYFQENALEGGREMLRTRRIALCFYLSDSALSISEPRVANSGMAQGEFMKRTVATKPDGSRFKAQDFCVGARVKLYGRVFHLVDCDDATRAYYREALGVELDGPHRYPDDQSSHVDEIDAIKRKLRAKTASIAESRAEATRKFHENAQKVLRFYVSWHDPHPLYAETRRYVLHYYLSDDTIEVVEPKEPPLHPEHQQQRQRVGNHHFAVLISRRRVVRSDASGTASSGVFGDPNTGKQLLTDRDLRCGEWVMILSRQFLLEDCDPFTRDYYLETHGVTQEKCEPKPPATRAKPSKWKLFQAKALEDVRTSELGQRGFSPAMLHRLDAHVQDNQSRKLYHQAGGDSSSPAAASRHGPPPVAAADNSLDRKQLRFRAKFYGLDPSDLNAQREFTLTYFLEDDTLMVFEPRVKNSGVAGGRFLDRGRFRKCHDTSRGDTSSRENQKDRSAYCASDFYVGAVVRFEFSPNQRLELLAADEQTLSYCESHCERFPFSNARLVLELVTKALVQAKSVDLVRRACRSADRSNAHTLSKRDFTRMLEKCGGLKALNAHQVLTLCRKFAASSRDSDALADGSSRESSLLIAYDEFCDALANFATKLVDPDGAQATASRDAGLAKLRKVPNLRTLLRRADTGSAHTVPGDTFLRIASFYNVGLASRDIETLMSKFSRNGAVEYHALCDSVFALPPSLVSSSAPRPHQAVDSPRKHQDYSLRHSPRALHDADEDDEFAFVTDDDLAQHCERPDTAARASSSHRPPVPALPLQARRAAPQQTRSATPRYGAANAEAPAKNSDARVVAILRRVFGSRKYQLRKALRERDVARTGQLGEEEFMDAVLALEPALSDDDTYAIADAYFPTNNSQLDYTQLLESAFRT